MTTRTQWSLGDGKTAQGELALPAADPSDKNAKRGAVLIVHEWYGLNDHARELTERCAKAGFIGLAVDLYGGEVTSDMSRARELAMALKTPDAMHVIEAACQHVRSLPESNGKLAVAGFCLGGAMALAAACNVAELSAVVPFYGLPRADYADWTRVSAPIMGHYGLADPTIPVEKVRTVFAAIEAAGKQATLHLYEAGHAFMRAGPSFDAASAALAWERTVTFLEQHLSRP